MQRPLSHYPQLPSHHDYEYRVLAIDPGTDTLGIAVLGIDLRDDTIHLRATTTFVASRRYGLHSQTVESHGDRVARLYQHQENLLAYMLLWQPHSVVAESPYMRKFPTAYAALTECVWVIRNALYDYNPRLGLVTIDPPTAKQAVGVNLKGGKKTKEDVQNAIHACRLLHTPPDMDWSRVSEHAHDAVAVGVWRCKDILGIQ